VRDRDTRTQHELMRGFSCDCPRACLLGCLCFVQASSTHSKEPQAGTPTAPAPSPASKKESEPSKPNRVTMAQC